MAEPEVLDSCPMIVCPFEKQAADLKVQLAAAQAERDTWRDQFNLLRADLAWTPSEKALEIERQQRLLSEAAVTLVDTKRQLTESEATVARLREAVEMFMRATENRNPDTGETRLDQHYARAARFLGGTALGYPSMAPPERAGTQER